MAKFLHYVNPFVSSYQLINLDNIRVIAQFPQGFDLHHIRGFLPRLSAFEFLDGYDLITLQIHSFGDASECAFSDAFDKFVLVHYIHL